MLRDRIKVVRLLMRITDPRSIPSLCNWLQVAASIGWWRESTLTFSFGPLLRSYQAIPTNRGGFDNASTKRAISIAFNRWLSWDVFRRDASIDTGAPMLSIRPGAAMVAARAGVPLVPFGSLVPPRKPVYSAHYFGLLTCELS